MSVNQERVEAAKSKRAAAESALLFSSPHERSTRESAVSQARADEIAAIAGVSQSAAQKDGAGAPVKTKSDPDRVISGTSISERFVSKGMSLYSQKVMTVSHAPEIAKAKAANAQAKALRAKLTLAKEARAKAAYVALQKARKDEHEAGRARGEHGMRGMGKASTEALEKAAALELAGWREREKNAAKPALTESARNDAKRRLEAAKALQGKTKDAGATRGIEHEM